MEAFNMNCSRARDKARPADPTWAAFHSSKMLLFPFLSVKCFFSLSECFHITSRLIVTVTL